MCITKVIFQYEKHKWGTTEWDLSFHLSDIQYGIVIWNVYKFIRKNL